MKQRDTLQEDLIRIYGLDVYGLSEEQLNYLPGSPKDSEALDDLKELNGPEVEPLLPFLLTWLQDMRHPIATRVRDLILKDPNPVISDIQTILADNENDVWSTNLIEELIGKMPLNYQQDFMDQLEEIVEYSEKSRSSSRTHLIKAAKAAFNKIKKKQE